MKNKMFTKRSESNSILAPINNAFEDNDKNTGEIIAHLTQSNLFKVYQITLLLFLHNSLSKFIVSYGYGLNCIRGRCSYCFSLSLRERSLEIEDKSKQVLRANIPFTTFAKTMVK